MNFFLYKKNKIIAFLMILIIFLPIFSCAVNINNALAEELFTIETRGIYDYMDKPYGQGYTPRISRNTMHIVLPLVSSQPVEKIKAVISIPNWEEGFFKEQEQTITVQPKTYKIGSEEKVVYLLYFPMALAKGAVNGDYPYTVTISVVDKEVNQQTQAFQLVATAATLQNNAEVPLITLESLTAKESLNVGEKGDLVLTIKNESPSFLAENVVITFKDGKEEILPINSNRVEIEKLMPLEQKDIIIPVQVVAKSAASPHLIESTLTYSHGDNKTQTVTQNWTVEVFHEENLHYTEAKLPVNVTQGDTTGFTMTFMNMGKGTLYNVLATFNIQGLAGGGSVLAGNIESGASKEINTNFNVSKEILGDVKGMLVITYEDAYGKEYQKELPLNTNIVEKVQPKAQEEKKEEKQTREKLQVLIPWAAVILLVIALVVQGIMLRNKIKHLEEKNL